MSGDAKELCALCRWLDELDELEDELSSAILVEIAGS